jgi:predicted nucleic acid-binding Zn ribbon protein
MRARHEVAFALPLCPQCAALSSARVAGGMGAQEPSYRLYSCRRCAQQVHICRHCDHGNQYCAGECAAIRRRESLRRAGVRYQLSSRGARYHAARQRAWRARQLQKVTHHGSADAGAAVIVEATATMTADDAAPVAAALPVVLEPPSYLGPPARCCFCGRALSRFARVGPLRGGP